MFGSPIFSVSKCCHIQGSHLIGYQWVSFLLTNQNVWFCYFFALNWPYSGFNYLQTAFILTNQSWVIFSCILLIIKITISEKRRMTKLGGKKRKNCIKRLTKEAWVWESLRVWGVCTLFPRRLIPRLWLVDLSYSFECDWLIELSDNNLARELVENGSF